MMILQINQLSKSFGADTILNNIKLEVRNRDRIAIVGRNGAENPRSLKLSQASFRMKRAKLLNRKILQWDISHSILAWILSLP